MFKLKPLINRYNIPFMRSWLTQSDSHHYTLIVVLFFTLHLALANQPQTLSIESLTWLLGALAVGLTYTFGFTGLVLALSANTFTQHITSYPIGLTGLLATSIYLTTLSLSILLPYYKHENEKLSDRILGDSTETIQFIVLAFIASTLSVGLYTLTLKIGADIHSDLLATYMRQTVSSAIMITCLCPALTIWKYKRKWPSLPSDPKEFAAWSVCLIVISLLSLSFTREWLALCALLLIWAVVRFSWFGVCLALGITTLFIAPTQTNSTYEAQSVSSWITHNIELIAWYALSATVLYLASLLADQRKTEKNLEQRVIERTQALDEANQELRQEIRTRFATEDELKKSNKRYRALIETAGIPVIVINDNYLIEHWNSACEAVSGYRYEAVLGKDFLRLCIPSEQHESLIWRLNKAAASSTNQENVETKLFTAQQSKRSMLWNINFISDENLEEHGQFLLIGQDISNIKETQDQLHYLAHFDTLTGAANRRLFEDRCKQGIETAKRYNTQLALISIDIDHFKKINDTLGHDIGDALLIELVERLTQGMRKEDTIARLGGDEFAILLSNISGQDGAELVGRNLIEHITKPIEVKNNELIITSSLGITLFPDDGDSYEKLLKNADMAMYKAKNAGRNNIQFYNEEMNKEMQRQCEIEQALRTAINTNQFELYYQPIIDINNGEIVALEALTRWNHPSKGILLPDDFLSIADQTGLLQIIGKWAFNQLCIEAKSIEKACGKQLSYAFNLTRKQYNHPSLLNMLRGACIEHSFNPNRLILELSENTLAQSSSDTIKQLKTLKSFGCVITIDGFGANSSSLTRLDSLPIDMIKLDRQTVASCLHNKKNKLVIESLLAIAKQLGIKSFASGVENLSQESFLQRNHCQYVQGFMYSEALPAEHLIALLLNNAREKELHSGDQIALPLGITEL